MTVATPAVPATTVVQPNATGQFVDVTVTGGTVTGIIVAPPIAPPVITPAIPASTVPATNNNPFPVAVLITGGTVTVVSVSGATQFTGTGVTAVVPAGGTITLTYSVVPTSWLWTGLYDGRGGTAIPSPTTVSLPPGGSISLTYSAAPTWAWKNVPNTFYQPVYAAYNTAAELAGYNPQTLLPYPAHDAGGGTLLGAGVTN
jgi:hypothetical protein